MKGYLVKKKKKKKEMLFHCGSVEDEFRSLRKKRAAL